MKKTLENQMEPGIMYWFIGYMGAKVLTENQLAKKLDYGMESGIMK